MLNAHVDAEPVQIVVHELAPARLRSNTTVAMPPPSLASAVSVTVPYSGVPGSVSVTVGATLSTRIELRIVDAVVLPALSAATARRS